MAKQMEMFDDGGLMDEGGTVDPVSGNDVPPGSNQEEVRDDIPAQLSEGEFVFPADVVRYFGLEKLMEMRQEAKMGLQRMEDMGQMGNSEEAIMPDNLPFDIDDIDMEDDNGLEMAQGGVVSMANGGPVGQLASVFPASSGALGTPVGQVGTPSLANIAPARTLGVPMGQVGTQVVVYGPDGTAYGNGAIAEAAGVFNYTMTPPQKVQTPNKSQPLQTLAPVFPQNKPTGANNKPIVKAASSKFQPAGTKFTPYTNPTIDMPSFQDTIGLGVPYVDYDPNQPKEEPPEEDKPIVPIVPLRAEAGDGGDNYNEPSTTTGSGSLSDVMSGLKGLFSGDDKDAPRGKSVGDIFKSAVETNNYFGGSKAFGWSNDELRGATFKQAGAQVGSMGLTGIVSAAANALGLTDFNLKDVGVAGFTGMNNALNSLGLTNRGQLMNSAQASLVGKTMAAAHAAAFNNKDVKGAINSMLNSKEAKEIQNNAYNAIKNAYAEKAGARGTFTDKDFADEMTRVERSAVADLNRGFNRQSPRDSRAGQDVDADFRSNVVTDSKGNPVGSKAGNVLTEKGKARKDELEAIANQARVNKQQAKKAEEERQRKAYEADKARAEQAKARRERAEAIAAQYNEDSRDGGGGDSGERSGDDTSAGSVGVDSTGTSTGFGSEEDCLTEDMKVKLNGVIDFVTNIKVGDMIDNYRVKEVLHKHMRSGYYAINNELKISNDHPVLANGTWTRPENLVVGDSINGIPVSSLEYVEQLTPTVSIVIDGESFDVHTENNIYTVHGRYREVRQEAA